MKSVKVKSVNYTPNGSPNIQFNHKEYDDWTCGVGAALLDDLHVLPGSTLLCLAPGERLPEAEGWQTVDEAVIGGDGQPIRVAMLVGQGWEKERLLNGGDLVRLQACVKPPPKPKTAVLELPRYKRCGACGASQPSLYNVGDICAECGAHFTETKEV
jgi:hypothetical protein